MTSIDATWTIYARTVDGWDSVRTISGTTLPGTSGTLSGMLLSLKDNFTEGAEQVVWAEIKSRTDGTLTTDKITFRTLSSTAGAPYLTTMNGKKIIRVDFKNLSSKQYNYMSIGYQTEFGFLTLDNNDLKRYGETDATDKYYTKGYLYYEIQEPNDKYFTSGQTYEIKAWHYPSNEVDMPKANITIP